MTKNIAIIGGGPAGLMVADILSGKGYAVTIYERKPSVGRKFLMAGLGGLNITHSEDLVEFLNKYQPLPAALKAAIENFTPQDLRAWCAALGEDPFIGSSGRVFPKSFKASPLLRAWIKRLERQNVVFKLNHDWQGWDNDNKLIFNTKPAPNPLLKSEPESMKSSIGDSREDSTAISSEALTSISDNIPGNISDSPPASPPASAPTSSRTSSCTNTPTDTAANTAKNIATRTAIKSPTSASSPALMSDSATTAVAADATLLALGGASWPRLGSDGSWVRILSQHDIETTPLRPSNCGFTVEWSSIFQEKFTGKPLKSIAISFKGTHIRGEAMIARNGIEGGGIYALSSLIRHEIQAQGKAEIHIDLKPDISKGDMEKRLQKPRGRMSFTTYLRKTLNLSDVAIGLLMERPDRAQLGALNSTDLIHAIKSHQITLHSPFAMDRAISSAGGIAFSALDNRFMLKNKAGIFVVGEMLDWEAPTGGYLLQACFATGASAAQGIIDWLSKSE